MKTVKTVLVTLLVAALLLPLIALGYVYTGSYNVAATARHWPPTKYLLGTMVHRSIELRSNDITVPELGGRQQLLQGASNYEAMCAGCHAPPGAQPAAIAKGLYPEPPDLAHTAGHHDAAYMFWAVKHGIKASGMPAWGPTHSDEDLWSIVALVQQFPQMDAAVYQRLTEDAQAQGAGHHGGSSDADGRRQPQDADSHDGHQQHRH